MTHHNILHTTGSHDFFMLLKDPLVTKYAFNNQKYCENNTIVEN